MNIQTLSARYMFQPIGWHQIKYLHNYVVMSTKMHNNENFFSIFIPCLEYVRVVWTDELTGAVGQDNFLLDKGRLSLQTIQKAYSASLVRISVGKEK